MTRLRCVCRECRAGDALPEHLQGIPGAYQLNLLAARPRKPRRKKMSPPLPDQDLRDACRERCADDAGDPPCHEVLADAGRPWTPCDDCKRDCGIEILEPIDPDAVVAPLL